MSDRGLTRRRVLATAVCLLDLGFFRIGSDRYAELNEGYGPKAGQELVHTVTDPAACRSLRAMLRRRNGGDRLLAYWERRAWHDVSGDEVNAYLQEVSGLDICAKDARRAKWPCISATRPRSAGLPASTHG
ncbi:hypothetical protein QQY66_06760 [Streptomyces sp. DG2A-72]|uniref:hypothetical protein n=1 Tax=Streptomyces sp. DG2A-72 TaxID=3051386 RepID=UPI00265BD7AB|nr:hypothetical protein [Streptomyces sp. DG2A-72]MDO0931395.1 hypothetical protein [Streptomyces sp. DG2A-72]